MTLSEYWHEGMRLLSGLYPENEASAMLRILCEDLFGIPSYKIVTEPEAMAPGTADHALERLSSGEPLQYVLGYAEFRSRRFKVGPGVLIPRPETEQLVDLALEHLPAGGSAIDLCTGSGCIAWSLALEARPSRVVGVDLSPEALGFARGQECGLLGAGAAENRGDACGIEGQAGGGSTGRSVGGGSTADREDQAGGWGDGSIEFIQRDILGPLPGLGGFDVLTCNPPYVMGSQRAQMRTNVLDWEPSMALFVEDDDPLLFYRAVAGHAPELLREGGYGVVEINDVLGPQTLALFESAAGLSGASLIQDFSGRDRFVQFWRR